MLVASSFDMWQKDAFFSAAEEVQESADRMESVYRRWVRERREGIESVDSDELLRELQTALGTAKWQLEEFEKAVRLSRGNRSEDNATARHRQFVAAIEDQISRVEYALRESLTEEGKPPLRWVNLDKEERDDLAAFLSGSLGTLQGKKDEYVEVGPSTNSSLQGSQLRINDANLDSDAACKFDIVDGSKNSKDVVIIKKDAKYIVELEAKEISGTRDDLNCQPESSTGTRRTWSSPNFGAWKIIVSDEDEQRKTFLSSIESTPKEKGSKNNFWKQMCGENLRARGGISSYLDFRGINRFKQIFGRGGGFQRRLQGSQNLQLNCSLQLTLVLMLTIFLIGRLLIP
ncbi:hypothetical protein HHK36_021139 [Tetracentron sinense]|uniref:Syntaxin 6/10/61 N-terminal domain-containing protein n=1 Tax=Tetracentron sinense TaxID=13715 RepID=A0A835DAD3_TETSI|nr:hypothetical protein HHK36_021139 [Tetracentron sinense]